MTMCEPSPGAGPDADARWRIVPAVRAAAPDLRFHLLDVGARPLEGEPFHPLLGLFPGSLLTGVEADAAVCERVNRAAPRGVRFHAAILGRGDEERDFHETAHPMCASLYRPNARLNDRYNGLEVTRLVRVHRVRTVGLDAFVQGLGAPPVDFVKLDVQGAELDVFEGGPQTLAGALAIVSEVEFVEHYEGQPLFGDVAAALARAGFQFHKFLGFGGRTMKPAPASADWPPVSQYIWSDALFVRDPGQADTLAGAALLKLAVLANAYGSPDVALHFLDAHDRRFGTALAGEFTRVYAMEGG